MSDLDAPGHRLGADDRPADADRSSVGDGGGGDTPAEQAGEAASGGELTVEDLLALVESLTAERDASFEARARLQAEFENYRKRVAKQEVDQLARAAEHLVSRLLPTLDAFEGALTHKVDGVEPIWTTFWSALEREGLEKLYPLDESFDPNRHEAVAHDADGGTDGGPTVVEVFRSGYAWKGRVLRPAMVKVRD